MSTTAPSGGSIVAIPAPLATNRQLSATSSAIPAATISRSCRNIRLVRSAADDTVAVQMKVRELSVAAAEFDRYRSGAVAGRAADVGDLIFESVGQADLGADLDPGDIVAQRLARYRDVSGDRELAPARIDIDLELHLREYRLVHRLDGGGEHREHGREWVRVLAGHDLKQRLALLRVSALVHKRNRLAVPFMNRSGPLEDCCKPQSVQGSVAIAAFVDFDRGHRMAVTLVRKRRELAVAAVVAGAVDELAAFELPIGHDLSTFCRGSAYHGAAAMCSRSDLR